MTSEGNERHDIYYSFLHKPSFFSVWKNQFAAESTVESMHGEMYI